MVLTVHHLNCSQSERIPFLCEELGIAYDLKIYQRAPMLAPPEYKVLHPAGSAPIIQDSEGDRVVTMAESGACMEYIAHKFGGGQLFLPPTHPRYADFVYWWHWGNGSFQPSLSRAMTFRAAGLSPEHPIVAVFANKQKAALATLDRRLAENTWLAGDEFTAADVMVTFSLSTFRYWYPYSLADYPNIVAYLGRISQREGYQRALSKCDPDMERILGPDPPEKPKM
jgi:glutathione S-transferase